MKEIPEIQKELNNRLSEHRYTHTLGVAYTAACLAMRYDCDPKQAWLAGLLHDCAKYLTGEEQLQECETYGIPVTETERQAPHLLHGKLGAWYAIGRYGVEDEEILSAIRLHTTGRPDMTLLEQILFVADYMEPGRREIPGLQDIRSLAFRDLDQTTVKILENTLDYLKRLDTVIDQQTVETLEFYKRRSSR